MGVIDDVSCVSNAIILLSVIILVVKSGYNNLVKI